MTGIISIVLSFALAGIHLAISSQPRTRGRVIEIILVYALVFQVGVIGFIFGFIPHVFFADTTAQSIGWATGSPFQFEVGIHDGAWGVLGFLSIWFKKGFRIATGIGWALFMLGAAAGHVYHSVAFDNFAEYNFLMIFVDGFVAFELPILLWLNHKWNNYTESVN
ncbi:MAG: hypothetical protein OZ913_08200 [Ignavibacteriaceae bacterium]|nr:MAG: hypothetical protein EDM69_03335 [Chlorobiota bacterium]KXK05799.1 MAG: hypothetical protein UZ04_CHB001000573 [Chlorobi bacterium OLB4]MBV6398370.1 hypothetical protein [Ignavibacteria bacterium]MCC6886039.1 hypothetical protein [Ignavibacteriales bacterium]MCE7952711.1 hypothetical protein [Chlorobi bacterium CHB7]MDL1886821.1 hypothetical protein [Ignavibacteria bacterium CHB1]MEB2330269.1 hypothetical protein [Ignavibacteriaceae bacterium]OQY77852.1 MAG: hypothetical protein B6D4